MEHPIETVKERKSDNASIKSQVFCRFISYSQRVRDIQLSVSLIMVPSGNCAKHFLPVNNSAKTIHHHHIIIVTLFYLLILS